VISRQQGYVAEGAVVVGDLAGALVLARREAASARLDEVFVIGGEIIYRQALAEVDRMYITEVDIEPDGDAWFPEIALNEWQEVSRECYPVTPDEKLGYCLVTLQRI
jgi:dihydrofolate reductase